MSSNLDLPGLDELLGEPSVDARLSGVGRHEANAAVVDAAYAAITRPKRSSGTAGSELAKRLTPASVRRYRTAVFLERQLLEGNEIDLDLGALALTICQVLEAELTEKLVKPCRALLPILLDAFEPDERPREVLGAWGEERLPISLGVVQILMTAIRRVMAKEPSRIPRLSELFTAEYFPLLSSKQLERAVGEVRNRYRNPIAHGTLDVSPASYAEFTRWVVGADRVLTWDQRGPSKTTEGAVLHHLLACWRDQSAAAQL